MIRSELAHVRRCSGLAALALVLAAAPARGQCKPLEVQELLPSFPGSPAPIKAGEAVALSADTLAVGAPFDSRPHRSGAVYVYSGSGAPRTWTEVAKLKAADPDPYDLFGQAVTVSGVAGSSEGTLYFGTSGRQAVPWAGGSGFQCVAPPITWTGIRPVSGTPGACDGTLALDFNAWMAREPARAPLPGDTVTMQSWLLESPVGGNRSAALSDAIEFVVCP